VHQIKLLAFPDVFSNQAVISLAASKAGRIFWCYGPDKGDITIIGLEPHPEDKSIGYRKITLSAMGKELI